MILTWHDVGISFLATQNGTPLDMEPLLQIWINSNTNLDK